MNNSNFQIEQELILALKSGSINAFKSLFDNYSQKLYRFSLAYLKSETEAEDIVQDVFLKIWENRMSLKAGTSFQSYLFTIAFNSNQKNFNKRVRNDKFKLDLFEWLASDNLSMEDQINFELLLKKLELLIDQMPIRRKEIFLKRKKEGKSVQSIALEMGISEKTVENQITEAMNSLRKSFKNERFSGNSFYLMFIA